MGFSRQEYWCGLPWPPLGDLPDPGIKSTSLTSPALEGRFYTISATWEAHSKYEWVIVIQSCSTLCNSMDCSLPGSSVHGILQTRILEWVTIPFSRRSSWLRVWTQVSCISGKFFFNHLSHQGSPFLDYIIQQFHFLVSEETKTLIWKVILPCS